MPALTTQQALEFAIQHHRAGRLAEAEGLYRRILQAEPGNAEACHWLGMIVQRNGATAEALELLRKAVALKPAAVDFHLSLGNLLQELRRMDEAAGVYRQAIAAQAEYAPAYNNLGNVLLAQGDLEGALAAFGDALRADPGLAEARVNSTSVLQQLGRLEEAIACGRQAVALHPGNPVARNNLGSALLVAGRLEEAISVLRETLALAPALAMAHNNLGLALQGTGRFEEALATYRRAVECDPRHTPALNSLATLLKDRGELEAALPLYRRAVDSPPATAAFYSNYLIALHYAPQTTLAQLAEAHGEYDRRFARPLWPSRNEFASTREPDRPLRLGFVSPHFEHHPVGAFLIRLLENFDREMFRVICYSDTPREDAMTARLRTCAEAWRETARDSDEQLARRIREDEIDILFDLAGHTAGHRLLVFARQPAPIQITWLDYVGTTGLSAIDYLIADPRQIPPEAEPYYGEKILRMPEDYITFDPPAVAPPVGPLPATTNGCVTFASFNIPPKTTPLSIELWSRVLREVPNARLLLKNGGFDDPVVSARYRQLFAAQAIEPERIVFRGWSKPAELLATYNEVDIALDTLPYNGGLTTCEALWMGVPVVTCPGEIFASRHGLAHLTAAGCTDTIAKDLDDYVKIAVALASDLPRLSTMREQLRARVAASPLCDGARFASHFAALLREVWQRWCAG